MNKWALAEKLDKNFTKRKISLAYKNQYPENSKNKIIFLFSELN